jgi:SagB-type dehydrogenase family enzyme
MISNDIDVAELFHENTKVIPFENGDTGTAVPPELQPGLSLARFPLPAVTPGAGPGLEQSIAQRVTIREYDPVALLPLHLLSRLLAFSCGYTRPAGIESGGAFDRHRAMPSAGATYPVEVYLSVVRVQGLNPGIYHYAANDHSLEALRWGNFAQPLARWTMHQPYVSQTNAVMIMTGFADRIRFRYSERGYRYMLLEAGHIGQNLSLLATAYGLGSLCIGGFVDATISRLIGVNAITEIPLYMTAVGIPRYAR